MRANGSCHNVYHWAATIKKNPTYAGLGSRQNPRGNFGPDTSNVQQSSGGLLGGIRYQAGPVEVAAVIGRIYANQSLPTLGAKDQGGRHLRGRKRRVRTRRPRSWRFGCLGRQFRDHSPYAVRSHRDDQRLSAGSRCRLWDGYLASQSSTLPIRSPPFWGVRPFQLYFTDCQFLSRLFIFFAQDPGQKTTDCRGASSEFSTHPLTAMGRLLPNGLELQPGNLPIAVSRSRLRAS